MRSRVAKVLHHLAGRPLIEHVIRSVRDAGCQRVVVVVGHQAEAVQAALGGQVEYALQAEQRGTGHAVLQAVPLLADHAGPVVVTYGDMPLLRPESFRQLLQHHQAAAAVATLLTAVVDDPTGYGRVLRAADGSVARIVEQRDATPEEAAVREINTGTYCFSAPHLIQALQEVRPANRQGEYYLTDVIGILRGWGQRVEAVVLADPQEAQGVNDRIQLAEAEAALRQRTLRRLMLAGVTVVDPTTTYVEPDVEIGRDTILYPFTILRGRTRIGAECHIGPGAHIRDSVVGDGAVVQSAVVEGGEVGEGAHVGPFAYLSAGGRVPPGGRMSFAGQATDALPAPGWAPGRGTAGGAGAPRPQAGGAQVS